MSKKKYALLTEEQKAILQDVHFQIIMVGLIRAGLKESDIPRFMESSKKTFNKLIDLTQEIIQDKIEEEEIRREIREEEIDICQIQ